MKNLKPLDDLIRKYETYGLMSDTIAQELILKDLKDLKIKLCTH